MLAVLQLTRRCTYRCAFCFVDTERPRGHFFSVDVEAIVDQLESVGVGEVALSGGEPTLVTNLDEIIGLLRSREMRVSVLTNGSRPRHPALAMVDAVQVSIDGPRGVHNAVRGNPHAFDRALLTLESAQSLGTPVSVQVTVTPDTAVNVGGTLDLVLAHDVARVGVVTADVGGCDGLNPSWLRSVYEAVASRAFSRPRTTEIACTTVPASLAVGSLVARLQGASLPLFVECESGAVGLGQPELRIGRLGEAGLAATVRDVQVRSIERLRSRELELKSSAGFVNLEYALAALVGGTITTTLERR